LPFRQVTFSARSLVVFTRQADLNTWIGTYLPDENKVGYCGLLHF